MTDAGAARGRSGTEIPFDVVVVGGGSAGAAAACAAAESGARTALVERAGQVGGTLAWQLLEHSAGFHDVSGSQVVAGFGQGLVDLLSGFGGTPGHIRDDVGYTATRTPVNHAELALAEAIMLAEAGVQVWLNCTVAGANRRGNRLIQLEGWTADGHQAFRPRVAAVADRIGVRESRRIVGEYTLTAEDVLGAARFSDAVARGAFPVDIHSADSPTLSHTQQPDHAYDIPYRCLVAAGTDNLLMAGRCISATREASGSARITATCFATGEAAGAAAALAARDGIPARHIDVEELRASLTARGALPGT
jgi:hypothetical protein